MTFTDTGSFSGTNANPFGPGGGVAAGNPGPPGGILGGPGFGGGQSKLTGGNAPGTISPFDQQAVGNAANLSGEAMMNRYAQLGLAAPGGTAGGIGGGPMPTAEAMDLGTGFPGGLPSLGGGVTGEAEATLGAIQNANLQQQQSSSGGGGKGGGGKGGIGSIASLAAMGGK